MADKTRITSPRTILQLLFFIVLIPFLPLLISTQWDWWEAWIYAIVCILGFILSRLMAARRHPDLIYERARIMDHENTASWDKQLAPWLGLGGILVMVVAGLDELLGWSPAFSLPIKIIALVVILVGYAIGAYALYENRFFSGVVRIQSERHHQVVSTGPYHWLRHPGYVGAILTYLATPFFLDSSWALLPTLAVIGLLVYRTHLEDKFLQDNLPGYHQYVHTVHYRLFPGIW
jgi:protein-S-isoprenylcysteine O-methyltransferase Ste14